jgi:hypothetical protein
MSKISTYEVAPVPKLADKLIGTSVGGEIEDVTYNFTLQELLDVFLPVIPANNLQGVLDYGNTATQDINLIGTITTTNLEVTDTANFLNSYFVGDTHIQGGLFDSEDSIGLAGQVLTSTGEFVEWVTLPPIFTPNLQQVLEEGNTSTVGIILTAGLEATDVDTNTATINTNITIDGTITDGDASVGAAGTVLSSTVTGVKWVALPVYSATSPLLFNSATGVFSIQQANGSQSGFLSSSDWINFNGKQNAGNYITALTGEVTASGPGSATATVSNAAVIGKVLTGFNPTAGTINASDSILTAFGKTQSQINALVGGVLYKGTWNASANLPVLTSSVGVQGNYYVVNVAGNTNLNGITDWKVGDWAIFSESVWQKVDNTESVSSVNGFTGAVSLTTDNIPEGTTNLYFLNSRARLALSATSPLGYDNVTGVFSIQVANSSQNGYLSSTDWTTFNGKQNYLGGTGLVKSTAGTITYITDNSANWDTAYNDSIISAAVTGTGTKTLTLTQQDAGTITASWTDLGLTSVGVSMPSAFNVANSPLTANGTIAITGAGNASQYVRGDGTLAVLPTGGGGGGASVSYYLNGSINQGTIDGVTYYEMNKVPVIGAGTDFSRSTNGYIASFLTDVNDPALLQIPAGNWNFETYFNASSGGGSPTFYIELYKYDGVVFTLIASNSASPKLINDGTSIEAYFSALAVPQTALTLTDRLAVRIYVTTAGRTITLHTENSHLCQVITTFTTGITAINGLTAQVQNLITGTSGTDFNINSLVDTHTFNLPIASATNTGKLSSTDWTTFNNKQNAITLTTTGTSGAATLVGGTLNIPQYQGVLTNPITGTGTTNTLPKFTGASAIGNSNITDSGSLITLGSNTRLNGSLWLNTTQTNMGLANYVNMTGSTSVYGQMNAGIIQSDATVNGFYYDTFAQTAAASFTLGNLVYYRAYQGTFGAGSTVTLQTGFEVNSTLIGATTNYGFRGRIASGTNRWNLYMDGTAANYLNGSLGIGTTSLTGYALAVGKNITGAASSSAIYQNGTVQSDVTTSAYGIRNQLNTAAAAFTLGGYFHYAAQQITIGSTSAITSQYGFLADSSMTGATNNYGFYGNIPSGTNRWNLYMNGTANNYLAGSLAIGTTSITTKLSVFTAAGGNTSGFSVGSTNGLLNIWGGASSGVVFDITNGTLNGATGTDLLFRQGGTTGMVFAANRRLLIGSTTDNGDTLQVTGTINSTGTITSSSIFIGTATPTDPTAGINAGTSFALNGNSAVNNYSLGLAATRNSAFDIFFQTGAVNGGGYRWYIGTTERMTLSNTGSLGIGSTSLTARSLVVSKNITGSTTSIGILQDGVIQSDVVTQAIYNQTEAKTAAAAFTLTNIYHYLATQGAFGAGSSVTNQAGFWAGGNLTGATNNYGFYGNIPSGTNRWNLYMAGTAANYMAGNLWIGTTAGTTALDVRGSAEAALTLGTSSTVYGRMFADATAVTINSLNNVPLIFSTNASTSFNEKMRIGVNGNVLIGTTTDSGFKLDVNGTARVVGNLTTSLTTFGSVAQAFTFGGEAVYGTVGSLGTIFLQGGLVKVGNQNNVVVSGTALGTAANALLIQGTHTSSSASIQTDLGINTTLNFATSGYTYRGIWYNPTITSLGGNRHIAIETVTGDVLLATTSGNVGIGTSTLGTATELTLGGSQTASSAIARGGLINTTLVAAANNDVLVGLDINPTFTNGAFTGVTNLAARINGTTLIDATGVNNNYSVNTGGSTYGGLQLNNSIQNYTAYIFTGRSGAANSIAFQHTTFGGAMSGSGSSISQLFRASTTQFGSPSVPHTFSIWSQSSGLAGTINYGIQILSNLNTTNTGIGYLFGQDNGLGVGTNINSGSIVTFKNNLGSGFITSNMRFSTISDGANTLTERLRITDAGNIIVQSGGTFTDAGFRLDVNGTARVQSSFEVSAGATTINATSGIINLQKNGTSFLQINNDSFGVRLTPNGQVTVSTSLGMTLGNSLYDLNNNYSGYRGLNIRGGWGLHCANTPVASAIIQADSTTQGFLPPRMTAAQRAAISSPATGLMVYQTDGTEGVYVYSGGAWKSLTMV